MLPLSLCSQTSPTQDWGASPAQGSSFPGSHPSAHGPVQQTPNTPALPKPPPPSVSTHGAGPALARHHRAHQPQGCSSPGCQEQIPSPMGDAPPGSLPFKDSHPRLQLKGRGGLAWVLLDQRIRVSASSCLKLAPQREKGKMGCAVVVLHQTRSHPRQDGCPGGGTSLLPNPSHPAGGWREAGCKSRQQSALWLTNPRSGSKRCWEGTAQTAPGGLITTSLSSEFKCPATSSSGNNACWV